MSVAKSIADAVVTAIAALGSPPATTVHRKADVTYKTDSLPACIVYIESEGPDSLQCFGGASGGHGKRYQIGISLYRSLAGLPQTNIDVNPLAIETIQKAFGSPLLSGVSAVWDTQLINKPEWESQQFGQNVEKSKFAIIFRTVESRDGS